MFFLFPFSQLLLCRHRSAVSSSDSGGGGDPMTNLIGLLALLLRVCGLLFSCL